MNIADVRKKFPQYSDLSDEDLAKGLHEKFYADIPYEKFSVDIGLKTTPERSMLEQFRDAYTAGPQAGAALVTGAVAAPLSGLAGIAGTVLPGPQGQGANWAQNVQSSLTYEPRTKEGKTTLDVVTKPFQWLAQGAHKAGEVVNEKYDSPLAATALNTAIQMAPAALSRLGGKTVRGALEDSTAAAEKKSALSAPRDAILEEGRSAGYVVPPDTSVFRGVAGKAALRQEAIARNQQVTNNLARKALGLPDEVPLTEGAIEGLINKFSEPYRKVAAIDPEAAAALKELREARARAGAWYTAYERNKIPTYQDRAQRLTAKADKLEEYLDDIAKNSGQPELLAELKDARTKIAKAKDVQRALNVDGNVDAHVIGNMFDKGKPLTGELATIGKFDQAFRRYTTESSRVEAPGGGQLSPLASVNAAANADGPMGWFAAGLPLAGGPARSLLLSRMYQKPNNYAPSSVLRAVNPFFEEVSPLVLGSSQANSK